MFPEDGTKLIDEPLAELVDKLAPAVKHSRERCIAMLGWLGQLYATKEDALRIAYAVQGYLPCFDSEDRQLEGAYNGAPEFPVYGRFMAAHVRPTKNSSVDIVCAFLAQSTILAGRAYLLQFKLYQIEKILKKIYVGRTKIEKSPHPYEISGCYCVVPSPWLGGLIGDVRELSCTDEMRELNRLLCKKRATRKCGEADMCGNCRKGRDQCAIAVRLHTLKKKEEEDGR